MKRPFSLLGGFHARAAPSGLAVAVEPVAVPVGAILPYAGDLTSDRVKNSIIARGWLPCDGTAYQITQYPNLYHAIGLIYTPQNASNGAEEFCVPDYRGWFLRGLATGAAQDPGFNDRTAPPQGAKQGVGSTQACMVQTHEHNFSALSSAAPAETGTAGGIPPATKVPTTDLLNASGTDQLTGEETRPKNIYVNFLIKAEGRTYVLGGIC